MLTFSSQIFWVDEPLILFVVSLVKLLHFVVAVQIHFLVAEPAVAAAEPAVTAADKPPGAIAGGGSGGAASVITQSIILRNEDLVRQPFLLILNPSIHFVISFFFVSQMFDVWV